MAFFNDFRVAINDYVDDYVTLSINIDLATDMIAPATAGGINVNEVWRFTVTVTNNGQLKMTGVQLHLAGQNGGFVAALATGPFGAFGGFDSSDLLTVRSQASKTSGYFYFKAPIDPQPAGTNLCKAYIQAFDVSLDHLLKGHTDAEEDIVGQYVGEVFV